MAQGWYVVARTCELTESVNPTSVRGQRLIIVRSAAGMRVFSAVCPHRGADLGAGIYEGSEVIRCPFHGMRIGLGKGSGQARCVPELPCVVLGEMILVRLDSGPDHGFEEAARELGQSHYFSRTIKLQIRVSHYRVIENAFDELHFGPVHNVCAVRRFEVERLPGGALRANSRFSLPPSQWQSARNGKRAVDVTFRATAYSPGLVVTVIGGQRPYVTITGSTPVGDHDCIVHLAIAVPCASAHASVDDVDYLLRQGAAGLEKDQAIWETLTPGLGELDPREHAVAAFQEFCSCFEL